VTKLFHIVEPDVAVFGRKDYQQWRVITRMVGARGRPEGFRARGWMIEGGAG
jgi:hypothetical protein